MACAVEPQCSYCRDIRFSGCVRAPFKIPFIPSKKVRKSGQCLQGGLFYPSSFNWVNRVVRGEGGGGRGEGGSQSRITSPSLFNSRITYIIRPFHEPELRTGYTFIRKGALTNYIICLVLHSLFHRSHNTSCLPPNVYIRIVFISLGTLKSQEKLKTMLM